MPIGRFNTINLNGSWLEKSSDALFGLGHLLFHSSVVYKGHVLTSNTKGLDQNIARYLSIKEKLESVTPSIFFGAIASIPILKCRFILGDRISPILIPVVCTVTQIALGLFFFSFVVGGIAKTCAILLENNEEPSPSEEVTQQKPESKLHARKASIIHRLWAKREEYLSTGTFITLDFSREVVHYTDGYSLHNLEAVSHFFFIICQEEWMKRARAKLSVSLPREIQGFMCTAFQKQFNEFPLFRYCAKRIRSGGEDESIPIREIWQEMEFPVSENTGKIKVGDPRNTSLDCPNEDEYNAELLMVPKSWPLLQVYEEIVQRQRPSFLVCYIRPQDMGNESVVYGIDPFERPFIVIRFVAKYLENGEEKNTECVGILHQAAQMHSQDWIFVFTGIEEDFRDSKVYTRKITNEYYYEWKYILKTNQKGELDESCKYFKEWFQRLFNGEKCMFPRNYEQIDEYLDLERGKCQITLWKPNPEVTKRKKNIINNLNLLGTTSIICGCLSVAIHTKKIRPITGFRVASTVAVIALLIIGNK